MMEATQADEGLRCLLMRPGEGVVDWYLCRTRMAAAMVEDN